MLCRNLVFTYFDAESQRATLERMLTRLVSGGALVVGKQEALPESCGGLAACAPRLGVYRRTPAVSERGAG